jgi:hypothetical protein
MDTDENNMAEKIVAALDSHNRKQPRGYPEQIDDGRLCNMRQHLRWLLETTWDEVGSLLSTVRTMADLVNVLKSWEKRLEQSEYPVRSLLRTSESRANSRLLYRQRKKSGELHTRYLDAFACIGRCWESLERFFVIPTEGMTTAEQSVICDAIYERARILARAGEDCTALREQEKNLDDLIRDGEAYFARTEFLRFCRSKRYSLNPLNVANALAGLPFIGCRQSATRCLKWPEDSGGLSYGIFGILEKIVNGNVRRSDLVRNADEWLEARFPKGNKYAIADLRENRYYLRRSIRFVLEQGTNRARLPGAISREYWKRKSNPTALDRAFAEDERIVK